jgi:hypothetical protein
MLSANQKAYDQRKEDRIQQIRQYLAAHPCVVCKEDRLSRLRFARQNGDTTYISHFSKHATPYGLAREMDECVVYCIQCYPKPTKRTQRTPLWAKGR